MHVIILIWGIQDDWIDSCFFCCLFFFGPSSITKGNHYTWLYINIDFALMFSPLMLCQIVNVTIQYLNHKLHLYKIELSVSFFEHYSLN